MVCEKIYLFALNVTLGHYAIEATYYKRLLPNISAGYEWKRKKHFQLSKTWKFQAQSRNINDNIIIIT